MSPYIYSIHRVEKLLEKSCQDLGAGYHLMGTKFQHRKKEFPDKV